MMDLSSNTGETIVIEDRQHLTLLQTFKGFISRALNFFWLPWIVMPLMLARKSETIAPHYEVPDLTGNVRVLVMSKYLGSFANVSEGVLKEGPSETKVAIKTLRVYASTEQSVILKNRHRFQQEVAITKKLNHENIVPLLGVAKMDNVSHYSMVLLWIEGMTLHEFIKMPREIVIPLGKRFSILMSIAKGLDYLHSNSIVHGDLSSSNVLIRNDGRVFICDFGLSRDISRHSDSKLSIPTDLNPRWNAPEIILYRRYPNKESDIYAFGSLILETLSGEQPYAGLASTTIIIQMHNKILPERPESPMVCDESWAMITQCWDENVYNRPNVHQLVDFLSRATLTSLARLCTRKLGPTSAKSTPVYLFSIRDRRGRFGTHQEASKSLLNVI